MNRRFASAIAFATTTAAAACAALISATSAHAETPTIDTTPFVSTLSRAEVQAELMRNRQLVSLGASEWAMQRNDATQPSSGYTRQQATAEFLAARRQVSAMTAEDSGSSHFAMRPGREIGGVAMAGGLQ